MIQLTNGGRVMEGWRLWVEGLSKKRKRTHGHGQWCSDCWGKGDMRGLNGNGENIIKIIYLKK